MFHGHVTNMCKQINKEISHVTIKEMFIIQYFYLNRFFPFWSIGAKVT